MSYIRERENWSLILQKQVTAGIKHTHNFLTLSVIMTQMRLNSIFARNENMNYVFTKDKCIIGYIGLHEEKKINSEINTCACLIW